MIIDILSVLPSGNHEQAVMGRDGGKLSHQSYDLTFVQSIWWLQKFCWWNYFVKTSTKHLLSELGSKRYFISVKNAGGGGEGK